MFHLNKRSEIKMIYCFKFLKLMARHILCQMMYQMEEQDQQVQRINYTIFKSSKDAARHGRSRSSYMQKTDNIFP